MNKAYELLDTNTFRREHLTPEQREAAGNFAGLSLSRGIRYEIRPHSTEHFV